MGRKPTLSCWPLTHTNGDGGLASAARRVSHCWSTRSWRAFFLILGHSLECYNCVNPANGCTTAVNCSHNQDTCLIVKAGKSLPLPLFLCVMGWRGPGKRSGPLSFLLDLYSTSNSYHLIAPVVCGTKHFPFVFLFNISHLPFRVISDSRLVNEETETQIKQQTKVKEPAQDLNVGIHLIPTLVLFTATLAASQTFESLPCARAWARSSGYKDEERRRWQLWKRPV